MLSVTTTVTHMFSAYFVAALIFAVGVQSNQVKRQGMFVLMESCTSDPPQSVVKQPTRGQCLLACLRQPRCKDFNFDEPTNDCSLYVHKPLLPEHRTGCAGYKDEEYAKCRQYYGPFVPATIPPQCCSIPFTLNGTLNYECVDDGGGVGCFHGDMQWKLCQQPADFVAEYYETTTRALSADPAVSVPLLAINGWILMQRKVTGGSVSFNQTWAEYRDGFGSAGDNDNYWLGLEKVYRMMQLSSVTLRIEIQRTSGLWYSVEYSTFYISDEVGKYRLTVDGFSGDTDNALMINTPARRISNGMMFSTLDEDNDLWAAGNCAVRYSGGWWSNYCNRSRINMNNKGKWLSTSGYSDVQASRMLVKAK